jgi:hypothetical protein
MAFLYDTDAWLSKTWCFWDDAHLLHLLQGLCMGKVTFAASVVLEGLCPQRIAVNIMNDHDAFVAKAENLWEMPHLIGVHCLLKFVGANEYIPFAFMWGWGGSVRNSIECFLFGGAYALSLTLHVSLLHFFRLREVACNIRDVD